MADPIPAKTGTKASVVSAADGSPTCWCKEKLPKLGASFKEEAVGDDVKKLHDHLRDFGFELELSNSKTGTSEQSEDEKRNKWGSFTTRAVRMFARNPAVDKEAEKIIKAEGKSMTKEIADKISQWCGEGTKSPKEYWKFKQLKLDGKDQLIDAFGADLGLGEQSAWHHHIRQAQEDLAKSGFGVHIDDLCGIRKAAKPDGKYHVVTLTARTTHSPLEAKSVHLDSDLRDIEFLVRKFQRQARWGWRMDKDGNHLAEVSKGDPTYFAGAANGILDQDTAMVLRAWVDKGLHMVVKKFELKKLHWPPESTTVLKSDGGGAARLRSDAYDAWLAAAKDIYAKNGTLEGPYASSPRGWKGGKQPGSGNSPYSWHYSALGVDINQEPASGDGSLSTKASKSGEQKFRYILENDGDKFRIWCWVVPQPAVPADAKDDKKDPKLRYRNRNIIYKSVKPGTPKDPKAVSDPNPLFHQTSSGSSFNETAAPKGWYLDMTQILEDKGLKRIKRHGDWKANSKGWEWWHYQFEPGLPAGAVDSLQFGEYLQLFGVHEYLLRQAGWPAHEDIEHHPG